MKNVLLIAQHKRKDTEDVNRRPETKILPKAHLRDQGTRQRLNKGRLYHTYVIV